MYVSKEYPSSVVEPLGGTIYFPQSRKNKYYVYTHHRASDGTVFYVGKGCGKRAYQKSKRTEAWKEEARNGYIICVLIGNMPHAIALDMESIAIEHCSSDSLVNKMGVGSFGFSGRVHTEEHKAKLSRRWSGEGNPFYGKRPHNYGKSLTEAQREKLRGPRPDLRGDRNPSADLNEYEFVHDDGRECKGTRAYFRGVSGLTTRDTTKLITKSRKKAKGWSLKNG